MQDHYIYDIKFQEGYAVEPNYYGSLLQQTARGISLLQQTGLKKTGIDIYNVLINLCADRVIFSNSDGTVSGKIWIDPTDGALHAVNAHLSGNLFTPYTRITSTSSEYIGTWHGYPYVRIDKVLNVQLEFNADVIMPPITADILGCEFNILNMSGGNIEVRSTEQAYLVIPSTAGIANTTFSIPFLGAAKFKAIELPLTYQSSYGQYAWICVGRFNNDSYNASLDYPR